MGHDKYVKNSEKTSGMHEVKAPFDSLMYIDPMLVIVPFLDSNTIIYLRLISSALEYHDSNPQVMNFAEKNNDTHCTLGTVSVDLDS